MSKVEKTVPAHVAQRVVIESVTCDCCGRVKKGPFEKHRFIDWATESWESQTATLCASQAYDGEGDTEGADLCYDCATWLIEEIKTGRISRKQAAREGEGIT